MQTSTEESILLDTTYTEVTPGMGRYLVLGRKSVYLTACFQNPVLNATINQTEDKNYLLCRRDWSNGENLPWSYTPKIKFQIHPRKQQSTCVWLVNKSYIHWLQYSVWIIYWAFKNKSIQSTAKYSHGWKKIPLFRSSHSQLWITCHQLCVHAAKFILLSPTYHFILNKK